MLGQTLLALVLLCAVPRSECATKDERRDGPFEVCSNETVCNCTQGADENIKLLLCNEVVFLYEEDEEIEEPLTTANVFIKKDGFMPTHAYFRDNAITTLEKDKILKNHNGNLKELDFSFNRIYKIGAKAFANMEKLEILKLGNNKLKKLSRNSFSDGVSWGLTQLYLDHNNLSTVSSDVFEDMIKLEKLVLDNNEHLKITREMLGSPLSHLKTLSLDSCNIQTLDDDVFQDLTSLEELSLRDNPIIEIPPAVNDIPSLLILDLSFIDITEIQGNQFDKNKRLVELRLENAIYLWIVHEFALCGLGSLRKLIMPNASQLYEIHKNAFLCKDSEEDVVPTLEQFDVQFSNLSVLHSELFKSNDKTTLLIGGNPWNCTCELAWMNEKAFDLNQGEKTPTCARPENLVGRRLNSLFPNQLCPGKVSVSRLVLSLFVLVSASIIAVLFYYVITNYRIRNVFYRPDLPHIGYSNLSKAEDEESNKKEQQMPLPAEV